MQLLLLSAAEQPTWLIKGNGFNTSKNIRNGSAFLLETSWYAATIILPLSKGISQI
jgi:hypothetical protein